MFFSIINELLRVYKLTGAITKVFLNETASVLDKVGSADFSAATKCLRDAELSNNKEREFSSAITLLKSSIEKLKDNNKHKFQGALIIGVCYRLLGEEILSDKYFDISKKMFKVWIDKIAPIGFASCGPVRMGLSNYTRYEQFKEEIISIGLQWKGQLLMTSLFAINPFLMNEDIRIASENAIDEFNKRVDGFFDAPPRCFCKICGKETEHMELTQEEKNVLMLTQKEMYGLLFLLLTNKKIFKCNECGNHIFIDEN